MPGPEQSEHGIGSIINTLNRELDRTNKTVNIDTGPPAIEIAGREATSTLSINGTYGTTYPGVNYLADGIDATTTYVAGDQVRTYDAPYNNGELYGFSGGFCYDPIDAHFLTIRDTGGQNEIIVRDLDFSEVEKIDPPSGIQENPYALDYDPFTGTFIICGNEANFRRYSRSWELIEETLAVPFESDTSRMVAFAVDPSTGNYWWGNDDSDTITESDRSLTSLSSFNFTGPASISVDKLDGTLWVGNYGNSDVDNVSPSGTVNATYTTSAAGYQGNGMVANPIDGGVYCFYNDNFIIVHFNRHPNAYLSTSFGGVWTVPQDPY